jgi:hypothetical protein
MYNEMIYDVRPDDYKGHHHGEYGWRCGDDI